MHRIIVPIPEDARAALFDLARTELREPRWQASKLLVRALARAGALPTDHDRLTTAAPTGPVDAA